MGLPNFKKNMPNAIYVFSWVTLKSAIIIWVKQQEKKKPQKENALLILKAALPWFMKHLNQTDSICMFSEKHMSKELERWKNKQLASYPNQKSRIVETCHFIGEFFHSEVIIDLKMIMRL